MTDEFIALRDASLQNHGCRMNKIQGGVRLQKKKKNAPIVCCQGCIFENAEYKHEIN